VANSRTKIHEAKSGSGGRTVALHLDFVAKPDGSGELMTELATAIEATELLREGLEGSIVLVSDREARLVTVLTFWDGVQFAAGREVRIAWMQKLLRPFADGGIRAHTSFPRFVGHGLRELPAAKLIELTVAQVAAG